MTIEIETAIVTANAARGTMAVATVKTAIALTGNRARAARAGGTTTKNSRRPAGAVGDANTDQAERCIAAAAGTSQAIAAPTRTVMGAAALDAAPPVAAAAPLTGENQADAAAATPAQRAVTSQAAATALHTIASAY